MAGLVPSPKDGDWTSVRMAIRKLASFKLGTDSTPTFSGLTLADTLTLPYLTEGSVLFAGPSGLISQDNTNLSWDDATDILTVAQVSVVDTLAIKGAAHTYDGLNIGSADGSDIGGIFHNNTDLVFTTSDGVFTFITDEGTNTTTLIHIQGKGTGYGSLRAYDQDNAEYCAMDCFGGSGSVYTSGATPVALRLQPAANVPVRIFSGATEGETQELQIYGFGTGFGGQERLDISVEQYFANTAEFYGLSNYVFDGTLGCGAITSTALDATAGLIQTTGDVQIGNDLLFPNANSIINFGSSDVTLTYSANLLALAGGNFLVSSKLVFAQADLNEYIESPFDGRMEYNSGADHIFSIGDVDQIEVRDGIFLPSTDSDVDLGTNVVRFKDLYIDSITCTGGATFDTTTLVVDAVNHLVNIGSADGSDKIEISHDNNHGYIKWNDGRLYLESTEDTDTYVVIRSASGNPAALQVYDEDRAERFELTCTNQKGFFSVFGAAPHSMNFQYDAECPIQFFHLCAEGESQEVKTYGFRTGDGVARKALAQSVGKYFADSAEFYGLSNYVFDGTIRTATSVWWRIQHVDLASTPALGAVGAVYTPQSANNLNGYQLDNAPSEEYLYFNAHVGTDWDEASDLEVVVQFQTNADNSGGNVGDTVDFDLVMYYMGDTETTQKTQDLDASVVVGQAAQFYHEQVTFTIDYDLVDHVVQIGDCVSFALHLNTTDSEVDNVIAHHAMFRYRTDKPRAEI